MIEVTKIKCCNDTFEARWNEYGYTFCPKCLNWFHLSVISIFDPSSGKSIIFDACFTLKNGMLHSSLKQYSDPSQPTVFLGGGPQMSADDVRKRIADNFWRKYD